MLGDGEGCEVREGRHAAILLKVNGLDDRELVAKLCVLTCPFPLSAIATHSYLMKDVR